MPTSVIVAPFVPPAMHTRGVEVVNVTGRPEDAVADAVSGESAGVTLGIAPNVIV